MPSRFSGDQPSFVLPDEASTTTTSSGLRYEMVEDGSGAAPSAKDTVTVHYAGWTTGGQLFDSSYKRGDPATFGLDRVIPGWTEGVQLMKPGATYRFVIPPNLAYGSRGAPPVIGPDETLVFQVQLLEVK